MARLTISKSKSERVQPTRDAKNKPPETFTPSVSMKAATKKAPPAKKTHDVKGKKKKPSKEEIKQLKIEIEKEEKARAIKIQARREGKRKARSEMRQQLKAEKEATLVVDAKKKLPVIPENENQLLMHPSLNLFDQTASAAMINGFLEHHSASLGPELDAARAALMKKGKKVKASVWREKFRSFFLEASGLKQKESDEDVVMTETDNEGSTAEANGGKGTGSTMTETKTDAITMTETGKKAATEADGGKGLDVTINTQIPNKDHASMVTPNKDNLTAETSKAKTANAGEMSEGEVTLSDDESA